MKIAINAIKGDVAKFHKNLNLLPWEKFEYHINIKLLNASFVKKDGTVFPKKLKSKRSQVSVLQTDKKVIYDDGHIFVLKLSLFHFVILLDQPEILMCLIENQQKIYPYVRIIEGWMDTIKIEGKVSYMGGKVEWILNESDEWIMEANCLHLAAKFNPKGLQTLLSALKDNGKIITKFANEGKFKKKISPLHVAACNIDSWSTW